MAGIDLRIFEEYRRIKKKLHHLIELIVTLRISETCNMAQLHLHGICDHFAFHYLVIAKNTNVSSFL